MTKVIRTKHNGCYQTVQQRGFGTYFTPIPDPQGKDIDLHSAFLISPSYVKIPSLLTSALLKLYLEMINKSAVKQKRQVHGAYEVSVLLIRKLSDLSQWRILVPEQVVSSVDVKLDTAWTIDLITGEEYKCFPPPGWCCAGSSHSHNLMDAFFSSGDNQSELAAPGLHFVVGKLKSSSSYKVTASITCKDHKRRYVDHKLIADWEFDDSVQIHSDVFKLIKFADEIRAEQLNLAQLKEPTLLRASSTNLLNKVELSVREDLTDDNPILIKMRELIQELYAENADHAYVAVDLLSDYIACLDINKDEEEDYLSGVSKSRYTDPFFWE